MDGAVDHPGCSRQIFQAMRGADPEPTNVCSNPSGLVHMHDCPVMNGQSCRFFAASAEPAEVLDYQQYDEVHARLMDDFLSRVYEHRVRGLRPEPSSWHRRREELLEQYAAEVESEPPETISERQQGEYDREKERLIAQRRRREEQRAEQEQKSREERARDRAKMGIKTVVEKAAESVAARGNVSDSIVDDMPAPKGKRKRRRRRRRPEEGAGKGAGNPPETARNDDSANAAGESGKKKKRRRRRRRRKPGGDGSDAA